MSDKNTEMPKREDAENNKFYYLNQLQRNLSKSAIKSPDSGFTDKYKASVFMRQHGFWLYVAVFGFLLFITPAKNTQIEFFSDAFSWLNGLESLVVNSSQPARTVAWYLLTLSMYPLAHKIISANRAVNSSGTKVFIRAFFFWLLVLAVLMPFLIYPGWDNEFSGRRAASLNAIKDSRIGLSLMGPFISIVVSILFYIPIQAIRSFLMKSGVR